MSKQVHNYQDLTVARLYMREEYLSITIYSKIEEGRNWREGKTTEPSYLNFTNIEKL